MKPSLKDGKIPDGETFTFKDEEVIGKIGGYGNLVPYKVNKFTSIFRQGRF